MREIARDFYAFAGEHRQSRDFDVGEVVDEVLELNEGWAEDQRVTLRRKGDGGRVFGDPDELRRALINLVSNAFEAMPEGGELVCTVGGDASCVTVEIRDTGVGLDPEAKERLFEPYFTTRTSGTGLGLAIVRCGSRGQGRTGQAGVGLPLGPQPNDGCRLAGGR